MHKYLKLAALISIKSYQRRSNKKACIAAVGVRTDGKIVSAKNGRALDRFFAAHAEARLAKKLDVGSSVYVARMRRDNGELAMSKPCPGCERILRHRGVKRVMYTINENEYGVLKF